MAQNRMVLLVILSVVICAIGCGGLSRSYDVHDVGKAQSILLKKSPGQGGIHALSVTVSGQLDGRAELVILMGGTPYRTESLSGSVRFDWRVDWYSDQAEVQYKPLTASSGNLTLSYEFHDY